jgi:hypothetical protein
MRHGIEQEGNIGNDQGDKKLQPIDIIEKQKEIDVAFTELYTERGYKPFPPGGLLASEDETVIFTGATITPLKQVLLNGVDSPGYYMTQKCLRTKNLNNTYDLSYIPDWTHYFTMCGILAAPDQKEAVSLDAMELIVNRLKIEPRNVKIEASSDDRDMSQTWKDAGIQVEEDAHSQDYYRWGYGIPGIQGRGMNIVFRHDVHDDFNDFGNVISMEQEDGCVKGFEFGFGIEAVLSKLYGSRKPLEVSLISTVVPFEKGIKEKFMNTLATSTVMYHNGIEPGREKEKHIQKKLVKGLSFLRRELGLTLDEVRDYGNAYELVEFGVSVNSGDKIMDGIASYEKQLEKFYSYATNQIHAHSLRQDVGQYLHEKLLREGGKMGILPPDVENVIQSVWE